MDLLIDEVSELRSRTVVLKDWLETLMSETTQLERESLVAHVDLCAMRYEQLNNRLTKLEEHVEEIKRDIMEGQKSLKSTLITTTGTIFVALISLVLTLMVKF